MDLAGLRKIMRKRSIQVRNTRLDEILSETESQPELDRKPDTLVREKLPYQEVVHFTPRCRR